MQMAAHHLAPSHMRPHRQNFQRCNAPAKQAQIADARFLLRFAACNGFKVPLAIRMSAMMDEAVMCA